jgi:hypothetical protein
MRATQVTSISISQNDPGLALKGHAEPSWVARIRGHDIKGQEGIN